MALANNPTSFLKYYQLLRHFAVTRQLVIISCALLLFSAKSAAENDTLYKIINTSGNVELKANITSEEAKRGYSVITTGGRLVKEVLPELSEQEYAAMSSERRNALEAEKRAQQQQTYDESLLLRYSNVDDLKAEWHRKLQEFDIRISILKNNRAALRNKIETQQASAANLERRNMAVPARLEINILELETEMKEADTEITFRYQEKNNIDEQYADDEERLSALLKPWSRNGKQDHTDSRSALINHSAIGARAETPSKANSLRVY